MPTIDPNLILEDDHVLLRPLQQSDVENLLYISETQPDTWHYSLVRAAGRANLEHYIGLALAARAQGTEFPFVVIDKTSGKYAGSTRFYDINFAFKTLQLGYTWYAEEFRGTKLNKRCKFLLLQYAFETLGMERVEFRADAQNARSIAAMKSIGCTVDGILRSNMPTAEGGRRDSIVLSILKEEWFNGAKANLQKKL
ncbi:GNAT family N-acetyltransferase [Flavobacterium caeni]|uniref:Protein N-acetyltransferase, RimJ/RimL family n=1 Tax=Flavobacterium caeni TaxID=490189 RepID=A0A1G5JJ47_9FLAO|nr:GNAT family protein [Flavobacterium caeni]SCY88403.1 Protein N-acetyltransferase, RimJ/RimL family [Flavobacterium caeni]